MRRLLLVLGLCIVATAGLATPAGAHAELTSTDPENLSTVTTPVQEVRFTFTKASEPVADRFSVRGPDGPVPVAGVESLEGGTVVLLRVAEPLDSGRYRVAWGIRAGDSHSMNGAIAFTVEVPGSTDVAADASASLAPAPPASSPSTTEPVPTSAPSRSDAPAADDQQGAVPVSDEQAAVAEGTSIADEVAIPVPGATEERIADVVRGLLYLALLGAVGGVAYLAAVHRGSRSESDRIVRMVRGAGVAVALLAVAAVVLEVVVSAGGGWSSLVDPAAWTDALSGGFGIATLLRLLGAAGVVLFVSGHVERVRITTPPGDTTEPGPTEVPGVPGATIEPLVEEPVPDGGGVAVAQRVVRRRRSRDEVVRVVPSPIAWLGVLALLASETFTGHTASTDPRWLVATSDVVHLAAGAVWATGAVLLCWTLWQRGRVRPGDPVSSSVLRFSTLAGWALLAVAVTGAIQSGLILGSVEALVTTTFGRVLGAKVLVVAAIAWTGWWNRRHLVPEFASGAPSAADVRRLRASLTVEGVGFLIVVALTAVLVVSSPV